MSKAPLPSDKPVRKAPPPPKKPAAATAAKKPPAGAASLNKKLPPAVVKAAAANASLGNNAKLQSKASPAALKPAAKPAAAPNAQPKAATPPAASSTKPQAATSPAASNTKPKAATSPAASSTKPQASPKSKAAFDPQRPLAGLIGPLPKHLEPLRTGRPNMTPQEVQRDLSGAGRKVAEIDQRAQELGSRPVDVGKAKRAVAQSDGKLRNFYKQAAQGFSDQERKKLVGLWNDTRGKRGAELQEARGKYGEAYQKALNSNQRQQLEKLYQQGTAARERQAEQQVGEGVRRAHQNLQEVQAKRHEQHQTGGDAKALNGQVKKAEKQFKAAQENARLLAAAGLQREADKKLLDQQRSSLSDSDRKALLGPSKELAAAAKAAQADPKDASKQARLAVTQANFDHALNGRLSEQQRAKKDELTTASKDTRQASQIVANEVGAQRELRAGQAAVSAASRKPGGPSEVQRRREEVAQARVALQAQDRQVRSLADQVLNNPGCTSDLGEQYKSAQLQNKGLQADLLAVQAQHNYARAAQANDAPVGAVKGFGVKPASPVKSLSPEMKAANAQLIEAVKLRAEVTAALVPAPKVEKPSTLDRALAVAGGLGEVVGGVALGIATGASGVGLAAGFLIALDGIGRVGHAVSDWENDTVTDTPQSKFMQGLGMSRDTANRTDAGIALGATLASGGIGATWKMITSGSNYLVRGAGLVTGGLLADQAQAQGRYIAFGDPVAPWTVQRLTAVGVDESQANALLMGAGVVASGAALTNAMRARIPGTKHPGFKQFTGASAEGGTPAVARPGTSASALAADVPKPAAAAPRPVTDTSSPAATPKFVAARDSNVPASSKSGARLATAFKPSNPAGAPKSVKGVAGALRSTAPASSAAAATPSTLGAAARTAGVALQFRALPARWFFPANAMSGGGWVRQQRARPAIPVRPRYQPPPKVTMPVGNVLVAFDGTGRAEAIGPPFTNIVSIADHYRGDVQYFPGVGSAGLVDRTYGGATGKGWQLRVSDAVSQLVDYVNRSPHRLVYVDMVGFSRGAAMARVLANVMANYINRGRYTREVKLRFLGLFDTVDTGMLRRPEHRAGLLKVPDRMTYAVQAVALHERRAFFPVASIEPVASNPGSHPRRREMSFAGAHTDIGGGYSWGDLSNLTLRWMMSHAEDVGVPMLPLTGSLEDVRVPWLHQQAGARFIIDRTGPGADRRISYPNDPDWDPAAVLLQADRVNGITRAEAEQWIHRFPDVRDKLAGIVDVATYTDELRRRGYFP